MSAPGVVIRRAIAADATQLAELRWRFKLEDSDTISVSRESFVAEHTAWFVAALESGWVAWVAEASGHLRGHVFLRLIDKVPSPDPGPTTLGYVTNFYVRPRPRNQGVGTELLRQMRTWAEAEQLDTLIVWPSEDSVQAYERAGFSAETEILERPVRSG